MGLRRFEGSLADQREDRVNSKRLGMTMKAYEDSPQDKAADAAGQRKLNREMAGKSADQTDGRGGHAGSMPEHNFAHGRPRTGK